MNILGFLKGQVSNPPTPILILNFFHGTLKKNMYNYRAKCQAVSLICWWIWGINVLKQSWDLALWISRGRWCWHLFAGLIACLALTLPRRWISPSPCGRAFPRGLWGILHAAISGITLRSGGDTHPSGRTTTPWCWQELLSTTSEEPGVLVETHCIRFRQLH